MTSQAQPGQEVIQRPALYLVPTPIGNLRDASPRSQWLLSEVDVIAAEDTRHTGHLLQLLGVKARGQFVSYHEHNDEARSEALVLLMQEQALSVALVSDAGTPGCADPGYRLVRAAVAAQVPVIPLPGPAAFLCALTVSGLPTDRFLFVGFLPSKEVARRAALEELAEVRATLCLYEAPHRLLALLRDVEATLGSRRVSVSRELTKRHEETLRGTPGELLAVLEPRGEPRGECAVVIEGAREQAPRTASEEEALRLIEALRAAQIKPREIKEVVSRFCGLEKKEVFALLQPNKS